MATNQEIQDLQPGDEISIYNKGSMPRWVRLSDVRNAIQCTNPRSREYGHWSAGIEWANGEGLGWTSTSVDSDERLTAAGWPPFENGERVRGVVIHHKATEEQRAAAYRTSIAANRKVIY